MSDDWDGKLHRAAQRAAGDTVSYAGFYRVVEAVRGQVVWEGVVSIFTSKNGLVFAWALDGDGVQEPRYFAILKTPVVDSPLAAVRAWLASESRRNAD